jgi:hypothetical protein
MAHIKQCNNVPPNATRNIQIIWINVYSQPGGSIYAKSLNGGEQRAKQNSLANDLWYLLILPSILRDEDVR